MSEDLAIFAETPLGVTENALHDKFRELIKQGKYEEASKVADLMEKLRII